MEEFANALKEQILADPQLTRRNERLLDVIRSRPSQRRTRILARLERHARVEMGVGDKAKIDWSKIDWAKLLEGLLKLFAVLLPLIV